MSEATPLTRREVLTRSLPAAGMAGGLLGGFGLFGESGLLAADANAVFNPVKSLLAESYKGGVYTLPPLPYAYDALEPHIDVETMKLHHDKHHQAYVDGLNKTLKSLADLRAAGGEISNPLLVGLQEDLTFNGSGHLLHSIFWATMNAKAGGEPSGPIGEAITKQFGSFAKFQGYFSKTAATVKGSGWAVLAYEPVGDALMVLQVKQHDLQSVFTAIPLLPLDVWEHAYYLKYRNLRADYIKAWWNVVNWPSVDAAYQSARKIAGHV